MDTVIILGTTAARVYSDVETFVGLIGLTFIGYGVWLTIKTVIRP